MRNICRFLKSHGFVARVFRLALSCVVFSAVLTSNASGALIRLGPFDIDPTLSAEWVYSSNIEGVRSRDTNLEQKDWYSIFGIGFEATADISDEWFLGSDFSVNVERHYVRDDLNTDSVDDLFGEFTFVNNVKSGHFLFDFEYAFIRSTEVDDERFVSGALNTRDPHENTFGLLGLSWEGRSLNLSYEYTREKEIHDLLEFSDQDFEEEGIQFNTRYQFHKRSAIVYDYTADRKHFLNEPADKPGNNEWQETQLGGFEFVIMRDRPKFTYTVGGEIEDDTRGRGEWELIQIFDISIDYDITGNTMLSLAATYAYEDNLEEDDIDFTYSAALENEFSATIKQTLTLTREPVDTFNSTIDTDSTDLEYVLTKDELFFKSLGYRFGASYSRNEPLGGGARATETRIRYESGFAHSSDFTRKITQTFAYDWYLEDVDSEAEDLVEQRVSLRYEYTF